MKNNFLIGLGGSGGKIITRLYQRLINERGESFGNDVACIAIDTDQGDLKKLADLGVEKVCLSGRGSIGQYYNVAGSDVGEWFPNTQDETVYFSDKLFNGASQSRIKSRLLLSTLLKDPKNELYRILENSLTVTATGNANATQDPTVIIASSLAGGTGSGTFIQIALYIKEFFRNQGIQQVSIYGLFALPDLYVGKVDRTQPRNLYSNTYAAIRELNAFNLICGPDETAAYGGKIELDIEISSESEGKLFVKNDKGRYSYKPYDNMYFIDKVNCMSTIRGGLDEYYKAMADIAYTHLYTPIRQSIQSTESNETKNHIIAPTAIYGSAGATTAKYPFDDILKYFASRAIWESVEKPGDDSSDTVWRLFDNQWKNYFATMEASQKARGIPNYIPGPRERAEKYIESFDSAVKNNGSILGNEFSFLAPMVERKDENEVSTSIVDEYVKMLAKAAATKISSDEIIKKHKKDAKLDNIDDLRFNTLNDVKSYGEKLGQSEQEKANARTNLFSDIASIDDGLEFFCKRCITRIYDLSIDFANMIFCTNEELAKQYDDNELSLINGLLRKSQSGEWAHPVAARYLLYSFRKQLEATCAEVVMLVKDTPDDDPTDFQNYLVDGVVADQKKALKPNSETVAPNSDLLASSLKNWWTGKKRTIGGVDEYFKALEENLSAINKRFSQALQWFAYSEVLKRIDALIEEYENFFDHLDDFAARAQQNTERLASIHDESYGIVYACASKDTKDLMYNDIGRYINTQTGEVASEISKSMFSTLRVKAIANAKSSKTGKKTINNSQNIATVNGIFDMMVSTVRDSFDSNANIQSLNKNIFEAIIYEYELSGEGNAENVRNMNNNEAARNKVLDHILGVLNNMAVISAPAIVYDNMDMYHALFNSKDESGEIETREKVSTSYRFISHSDNVAETISNICGGNSTTADFYSRFAGEMPTDTEKYSVNLTYVPGGNMADDTIEFYSAVNCLQPYQINKFNELKDGIYFTNYVSIVEQMEREGKLSLTPHLDKRWHKHGAMPYINVSKEIERRRDLAKAFIFALIYKKIGYEKDGSVTRFVFQDPMLTPKVDAEFIIYQGKSILYNKVNRVMRWLENQDSLVSLYAAKLDMAIEQDIEQLSRFDGTVQSYDTAISTQTPIIQKLRENIISPIKATSSKSGKQKKAEKEKNMGVLELAWLVHVTEENDFDKDYGEIIIDAVCDIIQKYAAAPFNKDDIEKKNTNSESYDNYLYVRNHTATKFVEKYCECKNKNKDAVAVEDESLEGIEDTTISVGVFGRAQEEPEDTFDVKSGVVSTLNLSKFNMESKEFAWIKSELTRYIEQ